MVINMQIKTAILNKQLLSFIYDGYPRVVEPHTYGLDKKGHPALRAYQIKGGSDSGEYIGWKIFHVDEIRNLFMHHHLLIRLKLVTPIKPTLCQ